MRKKLGRLVVVCEVVMDDQASPWPGHVRPGIAHLSLSDEDYGDALCGVSTVGMIECGSLRDDKPVDRQVSCRECVDRLSAIAAHRILGSVLE